MVRVILRPPLEVINCQALVAEITPLPHMTNIPKLKPYELTLAKIAPSPYYLVTVVSNSSPQPSPKSFGLFYTYNLATANLFKTLYFGWPHQMVGGLKTVAK